MDNTLPSYYPSSFTSTFPAPGSGSSLRDPDFPPRRQLENRPLRGRPRVPLSSTAWPVCNPQGLPTVPTLAGHRNEAMDLIAARGLENIKSECYRNAVLQILLNTPIFMTFVRKHNRQACAGVTRDCLICAFREIGGQYHTPKSQDTTLELNLRVYAFWDMCQKVFWGPRAQRRRKVGPELTQALGGNENSFMFWLLTVFREQTRHIPSEFQFFEKIFSREITRWKECTPPLGCGLKTRPVHLSPMFILRQWWEDTTPIDIQNIINTMCSGEHRYGSHDISVCEDCGLQTTLAAHERTENLPEILMIVFERVRDPQDPLHKNFLREIPYTEEILFPLGLGLSERYSLTAVEVYNTLALEGEYGHVFSVCKDRYGRIHAYNDDVVKSVRSWAQMEGQQRWPIAVPSRLVPSLFVYTRKFPRGNDATSVAGIKRKLPTLGGSDKRRKVSNGGQIYMNLNAKDTRTEKLVRDIHEALPAATVEQILEVLQRNNDDLDATMHELLTGRDLPNPDMLLSAVELGYRASILRLHVEYPLNRIDDIYRVLRREKGDINRTRLLLENQRILSLGFVEEIGDAKFETRMTVLPSEAMADSTVQMIKADYSYELAGRVWEGTLWGRGRMTGTPGVAITR